MCECKANLEAKLLERFKSQAPAAKDHGAELTGFAIVIDEEVRLVPCMPIRFEAKHLVKTTGEWKLKKGSQNMMFSFCPFCGVSLKPKVEAEIKQPETAH